MKKLLALGLVLILSGCASGYSSYNDFINKTREKGARYHASSKPEGYITNARMLAFATGNSQNEANQRAVQHCNKTYRINSCIVFEEGRKNVYYIKQQEQRIAIQKANVARQKAHQRRLISNAKSEANAECKSLGFNDGTTEFADCNLKLFTLYKQEAMEEEKIRIAEQRAAIARQQAAAAERQAAAAVKQQRALQQQAYQQKRRNNQQMINQGMGMIMGKCQFGVNC
jgi:hypothetical protein